MNSETSISCRLFRTPTPRHPHTPIPLACSHTSLSSFTLIEMLVVLGVIVILVSLMFPAVMGARRRGKQKAALAATHNIALALGAYRCEYNKWPCQAQATSDTTYVTNNYLVIRELTGNNPRGKVFLSIQTNMLDSFGNYVDPWGVPYLICMDEDADVNLTISYDFSYTNQFSTSGWAGDYLFATSVVGSEAGAASFGDTNMMAISSWEEIF